MAFWNFGKKKTPQELMAAGNYKAALSGFEELLKTSKKKDPAMMMQIGNLHMKLGHKKEAKDIFMKLGEYYGDHGFFNKAVAVFKKALNITPDDKEILEKLASYHNKVPKYILDSSVFGMKKEQKPEPEPEPIPEPEDVAPEPIPEPEPEPEPEPSMDDEEDDVVSIGIDMGMDFDGPSALDDFPDPDEMMPEVIEELPELEPEPEDEPEEELFDIDLDTINDLSDELTEEFATGAQPKLVVEEIEKKYPEIPSLQDEPIIEPAEEVKRAAVEKQSKTQAKQTEVNKAVFTSRIEDEEDDELDSALDMAFTSVDDALDSLFDGPSDSGGLFAMDMEMGSDDEKPISHEEEDNPLENRHHWALFRTMPEEVFMAFVVALETRDYDPGVPIVTQGDPGDEMFLLADGEVDVQIHNGDEVITVASLGEGDFFGEASLLSGAPRNATVRAKDFVNCLILGRSQLDELIVAHPSVLDSIKSIYQKRQEQNAKR